MSLKITLEAMIKAGCTPEQIMELCLLMKKLKANGLSNDKKSAQKRKERSRFRTYVPATHSDSRDMRRHWGHVATSSTFSPSNGFPPAIYTKNNTPPSLTPSASPSITRAKGHRIPDGWTPDEAGINFCVQSGVNYQFELDKFRDYWSAKAGKDACKVNWNATWRNWVRSAADRQPKKKLTALERYAQGVVELEKQEKQDNVYKLTR